MLTMAPESTACVAEAARSPESCTPNSRSAVPNDWRTPGVTGARAVAMQVKSVSAQLPMKRALRLPTLADAMVFFAVVPGGGADVDSDAGPGSLSSMSETLAHAVRAKTSPTAARRFAFLNDCMSHPPMRLRC